MIVSACDVCVKIMRTDLYIIALVVVATFTEEAVVYHVVDVELIEKRIAVLWAISLLLNTWQRLPYLRN